MIRYILRRLVLMIPVALLVTVGVFALARISPVDPVLVFAGEERDPAMLEAIRHQLGLDQPLPVQYVAWLSHALQGDLGRSFQNKQRVTEAISERLPATFELGLAALVISVTLALVIGILSAVKRNSVVDLLSTSITLMGVSFPSFFLGVVLILLFAYVIPGRIFPPGGFVPITTDVGENLRRLVLPAITLATGSLALNLRQVRSSLLEVFGHEYMRTARAKGLRESAVIIRHALKNALIPVVTLIGIQIGAIIEGAVITETIFSWPGVGRLAVQAIPSHDYPVVQGVVLVSALSFMLSTLLVDVLYAWLDPRISYESVTA
ncbi:MAG: ABC transporter permease [Chloroflexi bacterium]|nr:MAG: ABC transporter permease [Chloroflexota bacterium]TMB79873.1 MAG: ABC transporter permease [Chloroflexota bacterium]TMB96920.1 MAG: ABC transporter permease [Chloroflexota bacterium]TMC28753.1 MAG: ABC transporter permease [Chloroflexota bacterium]TMC32286.1 MAG: ABC transporter permease [Chloroflexota bacterium]